MTKQIILGIHGLGGHSGWFKNLEDELKKYNIDFYASDLPGFGTNHNLLSKESQFTKGHIDSYQSWINFAQDQYDELQNKNPNARIIVLGHSLGALIAANMKVLPNDQRLILSVPGFKGSSSTFDQGFFFSTLRKILIDKFVLGNEVYIKLPISEKSQVSPAENDPLRVAEVTQTMLLEIIKLRLATKARIKQLNHPCFMIQIAGDKVVDNSTQKQFFELIPHTNKQFKSYNGADHDWIWSIDTVKAIVADIVSWLN